MDTQACLENCKRAFKDSRYFDCAEIIAAAVRDADAGSGSSEQQAQIFLEYGRVLTQLARYDEAEKYLEKAGRIYAEHPGNGSFEYSEMLYHLGQLQYEQHKLDSAQYSWQEALRIRKSLFQSPDLNVAWALNKLGELCWKQGDQNQALVYLDEALAMFKETAGEESDDYADALSNRCLVLMRQGRFAESESGLRRSLKIRQGCLPEGHAMIGQNLANLAMALLWQGKHAGVEDMQKQSIEIAVRSYGEKSPSTSILVNNLGGYYLERGNLTEAARYFERSLDIRESLLGKESLSLVNNLNNLAIVYEQLGKTDRAQQYRRRVEVLMRERIEESHLKDIDTMILLADKLKADKKADEAVKVASEALQAAASEYGSDSMKVAQVSFFMGNLEITNNNLDAAQRHFGKALRIQKQNLGKKHPQVAQTLQSLATCLRMQGLGDAADLLQLQARAIGHAAGEEDPEIAIMQKMLNRQLSAKGAADPSAVQSINALSHLYRLRGKTDKADELYEQYLAAREKELGPDSPELAQELIMQALTVQASSALLALNPGSQDGSRSADLDEEDLSKSIALLEKATGILERAPAGSTAKDTLVSALVQLASAYSMLENLEKAASTARHAVEVCEQACGVNHWSLGVPLRHLTAILKRAGKQEEAEAVEARCNALPAATLSEQNEKMRRLQSEMLGPMMQRMLQGLSGLTGEVVPGGAMPGDANAAEISDSPEETSQ
jgi:tetratricopeptide (TPR) repeat protein